ncbi:MAG: hypothetical protein JWQ12_2311 [Glaciihabitans sp.]|nr:hypothetical protein [Glaciihabitans sp.]
MTTTLATVFVVLLAMLAAFQLALAAGLPFGRFAWGGQNKVLPARLRVGSALSVVAYAIFAFVALERADITSVISVPLVSIIAMWVIAGFLALSILPNLASKSRHEKRLMVPVSLGLATLAILVAIS